MKPTCFLLLVFLGFRSLTVSSFDETEMKSYSILRSTTSDNTPNPDVFTVNMKDGHDCAPQGQVWKRCQLFSATFRSKSPNRRSCSCTCDFESSCFVPSLQTCINASEAKSFGGECVHKLMAEKEEKFQMFEKLTRSFYFELFVFFFIVLVGHSCQKEVRR